MTRSLEDKLKDLLTAYKSISEPVPFETIIKEMYGHTVMKFDFTNESKVFEQLHAAMTAVCDTVTANPIKRARANEVGNDLEKCVIAACGNQGLVANAPTSKAGKGKSTGYPDVIVTIDHKPSIYLEVKSYAVGKTATRFRSFYLSPSDDPKVTSDGHHLLVGFEVKREGDRYWPVAFEIVDLYGLDCDMKAEFNSGNKRLYAADRCLVKQRVE